MVSQVAARPLSRDLLVVVLVMLLLLLLLPVPHLLLLLIFVAVVPVVPVVHPVLGAVGGGVLQCGDEGGIHQIIVVDVAINFSMRKLLHNSSKVPV